METIAENLFSTLSDMGFTLLSMSLFDENMTELRNLRAAGPAIKQRGAVWSAGKLLADAWGEAIACGRGRVVDGGIAPEEGEWYERDGSAELVRAFVPLLTGETCIGLLEAGFRRGQRAEITPGELRVLEGLARQVAAGVKQARRIELLTHDRHLLHTLMDNIPDSIYFKDTESRFISLSRALARKFGVADPDALVGKTDFDLFTTEHAQQAFDDEQRILRTAVPEIDIIEKETWNDNRITWVSTTKMPLFDESGNTIGTFGISRDITGRKEMEDALKFRLEFEEHITSLSSKFINIDLRRFDGAVHDALRLMGEFTGADFGYVFLVDDTGDSLEKRYEWHAEGVHSETPDSGGPAAGEWLREAMKKGGDVVARKIDDLPEGAGAFRRSLREKGVAALVYVPLMAYGRLEGIIGIESVNNDKKWPEDTTVLLKIIGEVILNAFSRKRAEEKLHEANSVLEQRVAERTEDLKNTNELLTTHIGQLSFLNESVYRLSPITSLDALLPQILDVFMTRFPGAQGGLCLRIESGFVCVCSTLSGNGGRSRDCFREAAGRIAVGNSPEPVVIWDRSADERLRSISWRGLDDLRCYVAIPLVVDNAVAALLQIMTTEGHRESVALEKPLLVTLAGHAAICLSNALNYRKLAEKARLDGELEAARNIQARFTPQHTPDIPRIDLKGVYFPAYKVGGDYLDYFKTERGDWVVVIADVCGKGIPAALLMTTIRSAFRILAETETSARRLLCAVNKFMTLNIDERSFVTALCLVIAKDGSSMSYARGGHPLLVRLDRSGGKPVNIPCSGVALGLLQETDRFAEMTEEKEIPLAPGDRYLMYTDGLVEATDRVNAPYGIGRLNALLSSDRGSDPETLVSDIVADVRRFTGESPGSDDLTLLAFRVRSNP